MAKPTSLFDFLDRYGEERGFFDSYQPSRIAKPPVRVPKKKKKKLKNKEK